MSRQLTNKKGDREDDIFLFLGNVLLSSPPFALFEQKRAISAHSSWWMDLQLVM